MNLPYEEKLEIQYLSRLFDNTSECYKFFWFQAIITKVLEGQVNITYEELINGMIANAWYMVTEYHLNLGPKDTLERLVHKIYDISSLKPCEKKEVILEYLSYQKMDAIDAVKDAFELCAKKHLNSSEIRRRIYRSGLSLAEFSHELEEVVQPVYQSAKNCGFRNWVFPLEGEGHNV